MTKLLTNLAKFRRFPVHEQRILWMAIGFLPIVWLAVRVMDFQRVVALMKSKKQAKATASVTFKEVVRTGDLVNMAARNCPRPFGCLTRSLTLHWILTRKGIDSEFRIGVRLFGGMLDAHAWVEYQDLPVNDRAEIDSQFAAFDKLPVVKAFHA